MLAVTAWEYDGVSILNNPLHKCIQIIIVHLLSFFQPFDRNVKSSQNGSWGTTTSIFTPKTGDYIDNQEFMSMSIIEPDWDLNALDQENIERVPKYDDNPARLECSIVPRKKSSSHAGLNFWWWHSKWPPKMRFFGGILSAEDQKVDKHGGILSFSPSLYVYLNQQTRHMSSWMGGACLLACGQVVG